VTHYTSSRCSAPETRGHYRRGKCYTIPSDHAVYVPQEVSSAAVAALSHRFQSATEAHLRLNHHN
jgi:hypothetical protein